MLERGSKTGVTATMEHACMIMGTKEIQSEPLPCVVLKYDKRNSLWQRPCLLKDQYNKIENLITTNVACSVCETFCPPFFGYRLRLFYVFNYAHVHEEPRQVELFGFFPISWSRGAFELIDKSCTHSFYITILILFFCLCYVHLYFCLFKHYISVL